MQDAWRAYLELALGATETSRKKAQKVARKLVGKSGATAAQLTAIAEEMVTTSAANREALVKLIRFEIDKALGRVGLATADEVAELNARLRDLEVELRAEKARADAAEAAAATPAKRTPAKKAPAKQAAALADKAAAPASKAVAKKTVAKKTAIKKAATPSAAPIAEEVGSAEPVATPAPAPKTTAAAKKAAPAKKTTTTARKVAKKAPAKKAGGTS